MRLKIEHDHDRGFIKIDDEEELTKIDDLGLESLIDRWIGIRSLCFNIDNNSKVRIVTLVYNHFSGEGNPENNWRVIADWTDHGQFEGDDGDRDGDNEGPYATFDRDDFQQDIRIDRQEGVPDSKFVFFRKIDCTRPLTDIVT